MDMEWQKGKEKGQRCVAYTTPDRSTDEPLFMRFIINRAYIHSIPVSEVTFSEPNRLCLWEEGGMTQRVPTFSGTYAGEGGGG
jgi:hypothetical protein